MLELKNISKSFPGVSALKNVDFKLYPGEIVGLAGENGAGKSTLIKILGGVYQPDEGTIELDGRMLRIADTRSGLAHGISLIYQELSLVPELSVAENLYLGAVPSKNGAVDYKKLYENSRRILGTLGLSLDPETKVCGLSLNVQQLIEIGKALARDARILVMDEPSSSLGREDAERLFEIMRSLKSRGCGVIFITHRLEELFSVCDRIAVLRDGELVDQRPSGEWTMDSLVTAMVNRKIEQFYPKRRVLLGDRALTVENLENRLIRNVSFSVRAGEIVGLAGLVGSGRTEVLKTICGAYKLRKGRVELGGKPCKIISPRAALANGIALVPENRKAEGLLPESTVKENIVLSVLGKISKFKIVTEASINAIAERSVSYFEIKTPSVNRKLTRLSGGNQQKIVFARIAETEPRLLLLDEPTRGIDIGSKVEIYSKIMDFAENGTAIILASSELTELLGLCDRILVMREGELVSNMDIKDTDAKKIMDCATGGK